MVKLNKCKMINFRRCPIGVCSQFSSRFGVVLKSLKSLQRRNFGRRADAGIIVIGNEILKAQVKDSNSFYACKLLYEHGIKVKKISIVEDDVQSIAREISDYSKTYDYVVTCGGIGPTHDDLTYEALATAFNDTLHYHPTLVDIVRNLFGYESLSSPAYKMACIPSNATLKFGKDEVTGEPFNYPCIVFENVYVFPGSPIYFETSFRSLCKDVWSGQNGFAVAEVYVNEREETFADTLTALSKEYPNVMFGSYPERNRYYKARITIESDTAEDTEGARQKFCNSIPASNLVQYDPIPHVDSIAKYEKLLQGSTRRSIYEASFERFVNIYQTLKPDEISIYMDCSIESIVMIHLARTVLSQLNSHPKGIKLHAIYPVCGNICPGRNKFVHDMTERYCLEVHTLYCEDDAARAMKEMTLLQPALGMLLLGERLDAAETRKLYTDLARLANAKFQIQSPLIHWTNEDTINFATTLCLPYYATGVNE